MTCTGLLPTVRGWYCNASGVQRGRWVQPRRVRLIPALHALADEIEREYPIDEATPRLLASLRALTAIQPKGPRATSLALDGAEGAF